MKYDFDTPADRAGTDSMKYELIRKLYPGSDSTTLPLWVADMDIRCSDAIIKAVHERTDRMIFGYTTLEYDDEYFESVRGWFKKIHSYEIDRKDIFYCPGIVPAISIAVDSFSEPGDYVLINRPVYHPFSSCITGNGRKTANVPLTQDESGNYVLDMNLLEDTIVKKKIGLYIFCSPHNPVGKVWSRKELEDIGYICRKHNVTVFSDEIHADITREGKRHTVMDSLFPDDDFIITGTAPSKTFNIPGIPLSNIIVKGDRKPGWKRGIGRVHISTPGALVPPLLKAAYNDSLDWYEQLRDYLDGNFSLVESYIRNNIPDIGFSIPDGTYLGWMDFRKYDISQDELLDRFIRRGGFIIQQGTQFGKEGKGFFRINVGTARCNLEKMLVSLEKVMRDVPLSGH